MVFMAIDGIVSGAADRAHHFLRQLHLNPNILCAAIKMVEKFQLNCNLNYVLLVQNFNLLQTQEIAV